MSVAKFAVKNSVLVNLLMFLIFVVGIFSLIVMPKESDPPVDFGMAFIGVDYVGVSPSEMETLVTAKIENRIAGIDGIDFVNSTSQEGNVAIMVRFEPNVDPDDAWDELNTAMNKVTDLPDGADDPRIIRMKMREINPICELSLTGDFTPGSLKELGDELNDQINNILDISKTDMYGDRKKQVLIDVIPEKLFSYGLTLSDIQSQIVARNLNRPGGKVFLGNTQRVLRTVGEFSNISDIENLIIKTDKYGRSIKLKDVSLVYYGYEDLSVIARLNGRRNILFQIYKKGTGNIIKVMEDVRDCAKKFEENYVGTQIEIRNDSSLDVKKNIDTLGLAMFLGIILVFFMLWIFLGWRNASMAALGIPFSFLLSFSIMYMTDVSINSLSLFALILVLGMIVDDAIVVIENVHRHIEMGKEPFRAAVDGTNEVALPVVAAVATTVAAFMPMLMMQGMMGKFLSILPIVVSIALVSSLLECMIVLPSHLGEFSKKIEVKKPHKIHDAMIKYYEKVLLVFLKNRVKSLLGVVSLLIISGGLIFFNLVSFEFFPQSPPSSIVLKIKTPLGTSLEVTEEITQRIEKFILNKMPQKSDVKAIISYVGMISDNYRASIKSSQASLNIDLVSADDAQFEQTDMKNAIRKFIKSIPLVVFVQFADGQQDGPPIGDPVSLRISGDDLERLQYISEYIKTELEKIPGVFDISDDIDFNKKEIRVIPYHNKLAMYGYSVAEISNIIWMASNGKRVSIYRGDGSDEKDIILRIDEEKIDDLEELMNYKVRNRSGQLIPLKSLAQFEITQGISKIRRRDKKRLVKVRANVGSYEVDGKTYQRTPSQVTKILQGNKLKNQVGILTNFNKKFPGYTLEFGGRAEEQQKSFHSLYLAFIVAVIVIYMILATQFKSYVQPLIVMTTLPFAFIGVIFGLFITRLPFSFGSLVAVVGLAGIVVNDSLVLVDFINKLREQGYDRWHSIIEAGKTRLRPIFLTTFTTIAGFMPMILSTSEATKDWKPIAVSMAFGLLFATVLTLLVLPCIYSLVDSFFGKIGITRFKSHCSLQEALELDK